MSILAEKNPYARNASVRNLLATDFADQEDALRTPADEQTVERFRKMVDEMDRAELLRLTTSDLIKLALAHGVALFQAYRVIHEKL